MGSLQKLAEVLPKWVVLNKQSQSSIEVIVTTPKPDGSFGRQYELTIKVKQGDKVFVTEKVNDKLPKCCVERHINPDGTFCLFYNSSNALKNNQSANKWWESLGSYLNNQEYAHKFNEWPMHAGLSHGDAAKYQIEMEEISNQLGWREEVLYSIFRQKGWLSGKLPRIHKNKKRMVNMRSQCPRGCTYKHYPFSGRSCSYSNCNRNCKKNHKVILKKQCPNQEKINALVILEYKRRALENELIQYLIENGFTCCGTMKRCPLVK